MNKIETIRFEDIDISELKLYQALASVGILGMNLVWTMKLKKDLTITREGFDDCHGEAGEILVADESYTRIMDEGFFKENFVPGKTRKKPRADQDLRSSGKGKRIYLNTRSERRRKIQTLKNIRDLVERKNALKEEIKTSDPFQDFRTYKDGKEKKIDGNGRIIS